MGYTDYMVRPGLGNTNSYMISGGAFLTGGFVYAATAANNGEICVEFPSVCRSFTVTNYGTIPLLVHFASRSNDAVVGKYHFSLLKNQGDSWTYAVKATYIYVSAQTAIGTGEFGLVAELTCIERKELGILSGSGINV